MSEYLKFSDKFSEGEINFQKGIRNKFQKYITPILEDYYFKSEFPFEIIQHIKKLNIVGGMINYPGCPCLSLNQSILLIMELTKCDGSIATFVQIQSALVMQPIFNWGTEEQKKELLPKLAKLDLIGAFALTEPNQGSDVAIMETNHRKVDGGYILNGRKRWIGNATFADIIIVISRSQDTGEINAFYLDISMIERINIKKIEGKMSLRIVQNADIKIKDLFIPDKYLLPKCHSFKDVGDILFLTRMFAGWSAACLCMEVYSRTKEYLSQRRSFNKPLLSYQIPQYKLMEILGNTQAMIYFSNRIFELFREKKVTEGMLSLIKAWNTKKARETILIARELHGGNGILFENYIAKAHTDIEALYTYEGTYDINMLIAGREETKYNAIYSKL